MKKLLLLLVLLLSGCATFQLSTLNHDPIYDTVLLVSPDTQIDTLNQFQLQRKLRTDFRFRYDFAQYALSQPRSFDWNNRVLGNRYSFYSPYSFGYNSYWNRDQMWNDWVWGYPFFQSHMWSPFRYDRWGYNYYGWNNYGWNGYNNWYNGPWHNSGYNVVWNRSRENNVAYHTGRRGSNNVISRNIQNNIVVNNSRPRINVKETKLEKIVTKLRRNINNNNIRVYNNPNNPNINNNNNNNNNNSKPRVYVRPNNNGNNNNPPRIYTRPSSSTNTSTTNVSRSNNVSRGGNPNGKN